LEVRSGRFFAFTDNLERELDWVAFSLLRYAREVSQFVVQARDFERAFLVANYGRAADILASTIAQFGPSLWTMEKSLLLAEYARGLEENKKLLSVITGEDANDQLLKYVAHYVSMRCELSLSAENYRLKLAKALDLGERFAPLRDYLKYRLGHAGLDLAPVATHVCFFRSPQESRTDPVFMRPAAGDYRPWRAGP
jgi:hypothetical protein